MRVVGSDIAGLFSSFYAVTEAPAIILRNQLDEFLDAFSSLTFRNVSTPKQGLYWQWFAHDQFFSLFCEKNLHICFTVAASIQCTVAPEIFVEIGAGNLFWRRLAG